MARQIRARLFSKMADEIKCLTINRLDTYRRKFASFTIQSTQFNSHRWRQQAEKAKLAQQMKAMDSHQWYI